MNDYGAEQTAFKLIGISNLYPRRGCLVEELRTDNVACLVCGAEVGGALPSSTGTDRIPLCQLPYLYLTELPFKGDPLSIHRPDDIGTMCVAVVKGRHRSH